MKNQHSINLQIRKKYKYWRLKILILAILGYATYYFCRQNFYAVMPFFAKEFGCSKTQMGWVMTWAGIVYAIGKFVNGYITDKTDARYFMSFGLLACGIITFFAGFSKDLTILAIFWLFNNWFLSVGWGAVTRMLTHWFSDNYRMNEALTANILHLWFMEKFGEKLVKYS